MLVRKSLTTSATELSELDATRRSHHSRERRRDYCGTGKRCPCVTGGAETWRELFDCLAARRACGDRADRGPGGERVQAPFVRAVHKNHRGTAGKPGGDTGRGGAASWREPPDREPGYARSSSGCRDRAGG